MILEHVLPHLKSTEAFVILFQTSASGTVYFVCSWGNSCFLRSILVSFLNSLLHFKYVSESCHHREDRKPAQDLQFLAKEFLAKEHLAVLSSHPTLTLHAVGGA